MMKNSLITFICLLLGLSGFCQTPAGNAFRIDYDQFLETSAIKYFNCGNNEILNPGDELTIMTWIQLRDIGDNQKIVGKHNLDESGYILAVQADQVYTEVWNPFHYQPTEGSMSPISMNWYHIAFTYKQFDAIRTYINGVEIASNNVNDNPIVPSENDLIIGVSSWTDLNSFQTFGNMDGIALFNEALTEEQIKAQMFREFTGSEAGLMAAYNFNETEGTIASDISGNGNDGIGNESFNGTEWVESQAVMADENTSQANDLNGLWNAISDSDPRFTTTENGLNLVASEMDTTDYAVFGHDGGEGITTENIPANASANFNRTTRTWPMTTLGSIESSVIFNLSLAAGVGAMLPDNLPAENYTLLWRDVEGVDFEAVAAGSNVQNGVVVFENISLNTNGAYSIGVGDSPIVGLEEIKLNSQLAVYPNPSNGIFNVSVQGFVQGISTMEVIDFTGKVVYSNQINLRDDNSIFEMNLSELSKGIYHLKVSSNKYSFIQKLSIE